MFARQIISLEYIDFDNSFLDGRPVLSRIGPKTSHNHFRPVLFLKNQAEAKLKKLCLSV